MTEFSPAELFRLTKAGALLLKAEDRLPVLGSIAWDRSHADAFFASGEREPPNPEYERMDPTPSLEGVAAARALINGTSPVHDWLGRFADVTEHTAQLLASLGTAEFYQHSKALYGDPLVPIADGKTNALELASRLEDVLDDFDLASLHPHEPEAITAMQLKSLMDAELPKYFGARAPRVEVTPKVSAKAAAGRDYIKLREDAVFSDLDLAQLVQHEALVHIATNFNGLDQRDFPLLAEAHPGNARTQEGLAVFAEYISGALDPHRFQRLAHRVIAIDMSAEGADFLELYRFFREHSPDAPKIEAFESARRVVRGGLVNGGGPFTKDSVYLGGLAEVHNYLRAAVRTGDVSYVRLLFVGKLDLADLDAMKMLDDAKLLVEPRVLPPWARDLRFLVASLAYSTFLNRVDLSSVAARFAPLFAEPMEHPS